jgi:hypothetical protein
MATLLSDIETLVRFRLMESAALSTPGAITVSPQGTPGAATWTYKLVALNANGSTEAGAAGSTTTGNATLTGVNFNRLTWTAVTGAIGYWIYRTVSGGTPATIGRIATVGAVTTFDDTGFTGDTTTAPTVNTSGLDSPFWSSAELIGHINTGIRDLWRDITDLKGEHFFTVDPINVTLAANTGTLTGLPTDIHKVHLIEPVNGGENQSNAGLKFTPRDYNHPYTQAARTMAAIDPSNAVLYYSISGGGGPVGAPVIYIAPKVTAAVAISFAYVPTLAALTSASNNPIPGESDNAVVAWAVAFARAKEREDRSPDPGWLAIYATEKQHLLQSLGLREDQEPSYVDAVWEDYWG